MPVVPSSGTIRDYVLWLVSVIVTFFLIPYLRSHAEAAKAMAAKSKVDKQALIMSRLKEFMFSAAADLAEKNFPALAQQIKSGKLTTSSQVHTELLSWGKTLRDDAVEHFSQQDIDLVSEVGSNAINRLIESAANHVSPFPGVKTSDAMIQTGMADIVMRRGIQFVKERSAELTCLACVPPCNNCPLRPEGAPVEPATVFAQSGTAPG